MDEKVKRYLNDDIPSGGTDTTKEAEKIKLLRKLGLCERVYSLTGERSPEYPSYDSIVRNYYREIPPEVTDEEFELIKQKALENGTLQQELPETYPEAPYFVANPIAKILKGIAYFLYAGGFIGGMICAGMFSSVAIMFGIWVAAFVEGSMMLGFGEIVKLLDEDRVERLRAANTPNIETEQERNNMNMKKRILAVCLAALCLCAVSCAKKEADDSPKERREKAESASASSDDTEEDDADKQSSGETEKDSDEKDSGEKNSGEKNSSVKPKNADKQNEPHPQTLSAQEFDALLLRLPVYVESTENVLPKEDESWSRGEMKAIFRNNSDSDIKNAVIAFAAWDQNNLPIKIKRNNEYSSDNVDYIRKKDYEDINMIPGSTYGESDSFTVDKDCSIDSFKAIVVSYENFDGETWENPYYADWCKLYSGVKLTDKLSIDVVINEDDLVDSEPVKPIEDEPATDDTALSEEELLAKIEAQPFRVISTQYVVQDTKYKALYPDMLQCVVRNDTDLDIKNAVVAFAAWDKNNLPVKIKANIDYSDGAYIRKVNYNDINMIPGSTYGESSGCEIDEDCGIASCKAIVVSYEGFDGETWENPYYADWCALYEGAKLK